jgi:hypothetical protein
VLLVLLVLLVLRVFRVQRVILVLKEQRATLALVFLRLQLGRFAM